MDQPLPLPEAERQAGGSQRQKVRGNLGPRDGILHQTASRLPVANQVFLGSRMVDRRVAVIDQLPRGDTWHPEKAFSLRTQGNQVAGIMEVIRHNTPGRVLSPSTWSPELLRPGKGTKSRPI